MIFLAQQSCQGADDDVNLKCNSLKVSTSLVKSLQVLAESFSAKTEKFLAKYFKLRLALSTTSVSSWDVYLRQMAISKVVEEPAADDVLLKCNLLKVSASLVKSLQVLAETFSAKTEKFLANFSVDEMFIYVKWPSAKLSRSRQWQEHK
jgi:hypothetical protein